MSRTSCSPFMHGNSYWARFPVRDKEGRQRSLGTSDKDAALQICAMLVSLRAKLNWYLLDRLADGTVSMTDTYAAWVGEDFDDYVKKLRAGPAAIDIEPYVARWVRQMEKDQVPGESTREIYLRHVRRLIPADVEDENTGVVTHHPFMSSDLTKAGIKLFLMGLDGVGVTNRYLASLSSFCSFLNEHPVAQMFVPENVARKVESQPTRKARVRWLSHAEAQKLIAAIQDDEARAWNALAIATSMERIAVSNLRHEDVSIAEFSAHAHGTKKKHRDRGTTVPPIFDWAWKIFADWYTPGPADQPVFSINADMAYRQLKDACQRLGVEDFTLHDWRHCFAVLCLKSRTHVIEPVAISQQMGHKNTAMLWDVYGQYRTTTAMRPTPPAPAKKAPKRKK